MMINLGHRSADRAGAFARACAPETFNPGEQGREMDDDDKRLLERIGRLQLMREQFADLEKVTDKWGFIRQAYMELMPAIMGAHACGRRTSPYSFTDWAAYFTPVERMAWGAIREFGVPMYPQFPVFNWFVDFGDPWLRIGLEIDGREFHDPNKDRERDQFLLDYGWRVFRVSGAQAMSRLEQPDDDMVETEPERFAYEQSRWLRGSVDGVVASLARYFYGRCPWLGVDDCWAALGINRLVDFDFGPAAPLRSEARD